MATAETSSIRIDKWLWAARFFKTRGLASEAIKAGKVSVNGERAKPSKIVQAGDRLTVRRGPFEYALTVTIISKHRGPSAQAAALYREDQESIEERERLTLQLKAQSAARPRFPGRPSKRERRKIIQFTGKGGSNP